MKRTALVLVLIAALLVAGTVPAAMQSSGTMSTAFAVQNLGDSSATVTASFYQADGTHTTDLTETVDVGANFNFDQRYDSGNPGVEPFQGSAIVSADQPIGAAANIVRTGGIVPAYESYNALSTDAIGMDLLLPQILKNVPSGGLLYNTTIVIQNTDTANPADVDIVFNPDPVVNAAVGGTLTEAYTHSVMIPAGGAAYIDQATTPNDAQIGAIFFGSARVLADRDVAPVVYNDGGGQVLFALPSYAGGSTDAIFMPSVYKEISSLGDSYSTAFLIVNFGDADATVEIEYLPIVGTVGTVDTVTVPAKGSLNVDQRYVAGITSASFFGAAVIQSTNSQPIAAMVNLRGGTRYGMTYGALMAGSTTAAYIPIAYKDVASGGYSWSSTIVVQNMGAGDADVQFTFYPSGAAAIADVDTYTVTAAEGVKQFDLRYTTAIGAGGADEQALFIGAVKVEAVSGTIGVMLQTRGGGGTGDALMAFQALNP